MKLDAMAMGLPLREAQRLAADVEEAGFSGLWFTEGGRTAYLGATAAALATTELDLGTGIAVAFPRSPMITASVAWELAEATGGRFVLGLGTQVKAHIERRYGVTYEHPGPWLREYVLALRAIFRAFQGEERLDFHGERYHLDLLPPTWSPGPIEHPDVPIFLSGVRPWMLQATGEVADGLHVHPLHSRRYLDEVVVPNLAKGLSAAERPVTDVTLACPVLTIMGDTDEEQDRWREAARFQLAFYGSTRTYRGVFETHGWDGTSERLHEHQKAGDLAAMAAVITDEMLDAFAVTASWDGLAPALLERYAGVEHPVRVICYFAGNSIRLDQTFDQWAAVAAAVRAAAS
ncbi:MAG TPA: TIGR03617 family F420-dependent LLM class oxidoreductase [Acidimicrobiales bacterium]